MAIRSFILIILTLCAAPAQQTTRKRIVPTTVIGVLTLPDGSKFETTLYNMKIIGRLRTTKKLPYFILAGTTCRECDENTSIYIHSPSDGPMKNEAEQRRFSYPGHEKDYETGRTVYEAKMFFGNCLEAYPNAVIWFERSLANDEKWHSIVSVAQVRNDRLLFSQLEDQLPEMAEAQEAVRNRKCHELPGIDVTSEP